MPDRVPEPAALAWVRQETVGPAAPAAHGHTTTLLGKHKSSRLVVFGGQGQDNSMCGPLRSNPFHQHRNGILHAVG